MRVYIPATLAMLQSLNESGEFVPVGGTAFALTPALREAYTAGDDEELSEAALREAARASLRLLDGEVGDLAPLPPRRVVVAAPLAGGAVPRRGCCAPGAASIRAGRRACGRARSWGRGLQLTGRHLAVAAVDAADLGDLDAELAIGDVEDFDLGWYATQELPFLLELL